MIELIPAIDIIDGKCVRLTKGDYAQKKVYNEDPVSVAMEFERLGFKRLHVVDLDGAKSKHIVNVDVLKKISESTQLTIDFGGGIKSDDDIRQAFQCGADMVTIGSIAITDKAKLIAWMETYGAERIILGADVRNGKVSGNGWKDDSEEQLLPFLEYYIAHGITKVLCTDISRDGTLAGPSLDLYRQIMQAFPQLHLVASGGVAGNSDIIELNKAGIPAVVFGKAYYEGKIKLDSLWDSLKE